MYTHVHEIDMCLMTTGALCVPSILCARTPIERKKTYEFKCGVLTDLFSDTVHESNVYVLFGADTAGVQ
jgi:hypothetical protein